MSKAKIIDKKSVDSILGEKKLLSELHHPFIVNMIYSFQDHDYLYLVMDLLPGGNLRYHLSIRNTFKENQIKFLIGCIMIGLKYIHGQNILHRDIKPENLVFDNNGYLRITDFGIAKHYVINNKKDTSGTIGYLAPEVLCNVNHNFSIDYYAVGIITYELMYGHRPYIGKNKHEVKQLILTKQAEIDYTDLPNGFSNEIADFINRLIQRKPKNRLGKDSINEVIGHPWFEGFDWENVKKKKNKAPYIPKNGDNFDKKYCLQSNKIGTDTMERYKKIMMEKNYNLIFKDFNCNKIPNELCSYSRKKTNEKFYGVNNNNITSNISTTSISRNNKNENKQNNLIHPYNNNLMNTNLFRKNNKNNKNEDIDYNNDFDKEIFKQIATLNKSLHNLVALNKNNSINKNNNNKNIIQNKKKSKPEFIHNKSSINLFRNNKDNLFNNYNNINKTYRNDNINKRNINENINNNNYLDISLTIDQNNNNNNHNNNIFSHNQKNISGGLDNDNIIFNEKKLIENIINKRNAHLNCNMSMSKLNINNKSKHITNTSSIEEQNSIIGLNSGILKNMKYQYQELKPNKRNKFLNYSIKDISKIQKNQNNIINNLYNNNNNDNDNNYNNIINNNYYNKINNSIIQSNNNQKLKRNTNISMPKSKKDYIRKELLRNTTLYNPNQSLRQKQKKASILMDSNMYSKKKMNLSGNSIINNSKRLSSSHSMQNINFKNELIREEVGNFTIINKKSNCINSDRTLKNISINDKKLPFINISFNKKQGEPFSNDIYYVSYGKYNRNNKIKFNESSGNINNEYFMDNFRNKKIKNNNTKINYNNKSVNNFFDNYMKI